MPFVMPLFLESEKIIIIISPLNALEVDQVRVSSASDPARFHALTVDMIFTQASRFRKMGLSAVAVNGDTYSNEIHKGMFYLYGFDVL